MKEMINPSVKAIINKAIEKNMPVIKLGEGNFYQIGYGKMGRIFSDTLGEKISGTSLKLLDDKLLISEFLKSHHIPAVTRKKPNNIKELLELSNNIEYPIVLKTQYKNNNTNAIFNINDDKTLEKSYKKISKQHKDVILEEYIQGKNFKVCMINYKVVAVALMRITTSVEEDVVYPSESILEDFTDIICEENKKICEKTAKILGLDICEIDICSKDISSSLNNNGGIIDINVNPNIDVYQNFHKGQKRDIADIILNMIYENHIENIPVISILGDNKENIITKGINYILSKMGYIVGAKTKNKIIINNEYVNKEESNLNIDAKSIFLNKEIDISIINQTKEDGIHKGLDYDLCDVAIIKEYDILNKKEKLDNLDLEKLVLNSVKDEGCLVVNIECYNNLNKENEMKIKKILFSINNEDEFLKQNIERGNSVVYIDNQIIYAQNNKNKYKICSIKDIPIISKQASKEEIENILAICAGLIGLKVDYCMIAKGLKTFKVD